MKKNRLCALLGIEYPIVQAPMNWITGADLAAAVSNSGGLGSIGPNAGATEITPDVDETGERLRGQIRKAKELTNKPFAVNITIGLDEFSRAFSQRCVNVVLEEGVAVVITSVGPPNVYTDELKKTGIKVIHAVSSPSQCVKSEKMGVDAVVCEGYEGGGHKSVVGLTTMTMIPMAVDVTTLPVIAAGGIADARGVTAAFALGAEGVYMGTRFMVADECDAHPDVKNSVIGAHDTATVALNKLIVTGRNLENDFTRKYVEMLNSGAPAEEMFKMLGEGGMHKALVKGETEKGELPCGQIAGMLKQQTSAADIIQEIMDNLSVVVASLKERLPIDLTPKS